MSKKRVKLGLNKETMRKLSDTDLKDAGGAGNLYLPLRGTVWTQCGCPGGGGGPGTFSGTCTGAAFNWNFNFNYFGWG